MPVTESTAEIIARHEAEDAARRARWLTPADEAFIEATARKAAFSFGTEKDIVGRVRAEIWRAALDVERASADLPVWSAIGLRILTDEAVIIDVKRTYRGPDPVGLPALAEKVEALLADREAEADEEWPVDAAAHALARRWVAASPYTVYRFHRCVTEAAADAARDAAEELVVGDTGHGPSIARATEEAAGRWLKAWMKEGKAL